MKKKSRMWITLVPLIAVMVAIFCFSAQPSVESANTSSGLVFGVIRLTIPDFDNLSARDRWETHKVVELIVRKAAHMAEYAALGFFAYLHAFTANPDKRKKTFLVSLLFCALYAASDEIHQAFVPGRYATVVDVGVDTVGSLIGILIISAVITAAERRKKKKCRIK